MREQTTGRDLAFAWPASETCTGAGFPEQLSPESEHRLFPSVRRAVVLGRAFTPQEDAARREGRRRSAMRFGGGVLPRIPRIVGQTISLSGSPYVVIGIIGPNFDIRD